MQIEVYFLLCYVNSAALVSSYFADLNEQRIKFKVQLMPDICF